MTVSPEKGSLFVNHQSKHRSGHLGHALVEYAPGKLLAFYPNCAAGRNHGHNGFGWVEYKRSVDAGETWSEPVILQCSMDAFLDGVYSLACEKAVCTLDGTIVVTCLRCQYQPAWEPFLSPLYIVSKDYGETWSEPKELNPTPGRVYDMIIENNVIYALHFSNDSKVSFAGNQKDHRYILLESTDNAESFHEKSVVPFDTFGKAYGALMVMNDGRLRAYAYNIKDEFNLDVCESIDMGETWKSLDPSYVAKRIRNPQLAKLGNTYYLHGRSGCESDDLPREFVLYTSKDALHWDEGMYIYTCPEGAWGQSCFYSNNVIVHSPHGERLLIQSSVSYEEARTNICHLWIT